MAWKPTGRPTVRKQREKWAVHVDGIDTETGEHRPRQLGTFTSRRTALGHSPDMLMKTYAHALPESVRTVTEKIGQRATARRVRDSGL